MPSSLPSLARAAALAFMLPPTLFHGVATASHVMAQPGTQGYIGLDAQRTGANPPPFANAVASPGDLDQGFGEGGRVTVPSRGFALPSGDGKYWVVTKRENRPGRVEVRRLLENGAKDPTFPLDGAIVDLYPGAQDFELFAVQLQSSGKIVLAGRLLLGDGSSTPLFARLGLDGQRDASFGENGIKLIHFQDDALLRYVYSISIQPDDRIVASTLSAIGDMMVPRLIRLHADGGQDAGFGSDGIVYDVPQGMIFLDTAVLEDGRLIFGGMSEPDGAAVLMRLQANGNLDESFGGSGFVSLKHSDYPGMRVNGIALSPLDGSVVAGGVSLTPDISGWLAKVLPDGSLDKGFNNGSPLFTDHLSIHKLAIQDDGKIVLHGASRTPSQSYMAIGRIHPRGSFDASFGVDGIALTPYPAQSPYSNAYSYSEIQGTKLFASDVVMFDDVYHVQLLRYTLSDPRSTRAGTAFD